MIDPRSILLTRGAVFLRGFYFCLGAGDSSAVSLLEKIPSTMSLQFHFAKSGGSVSTDADGELSYSIFPACLEVLHRTHKGRKKPSLLSFSFQQEKCLSDVGGGRVGGSPWLVRKHCFYVISFHTPAMCGK